MAFQINNKIGTHAPLVPSVKKRYQNNMIEVFLLVLVIVLFYFFIVSPKRADLNTKKGQAVILREEQSKLAEDLSNLQALIRELKNSPRDVEKLDEALPLNHNIIRANLLVEELARSAGVSIADLNVTGENDVVVAGNVELLEAPFEPERSVKILDVAVNALGSFQQLKAFLQKVENNGRIMNVRALQITGSEEGLLNLKVNLEAYYYAP